MQIVSNNIETEHTPEVHMPSSVGREAAYAGRNPMFKSQGGQSAYSLKRKQNTPEKHPSLNLTFTNYIKHPTHQT